MRMGLGGRAAKQAAPNKTELAREYHRRFPHAGTLTLAKRMRRDEPRLFLSVEQARSALRTARGNHGAYQRRRNSPECYRPNGKSGDGFAAIPEGRRQLGDWDAFRIGGSHRALIISDVHVPYHDAGAIRIALADAKAHDADALILNGDICDAYSLSRYEKDPRLRDFPEEVRITKEFLSVLRGEFPKARIIWKEGNHEERFDAYMKRCAPDLLGIDLFTLSSCFGLDKLGIELIGEKRPVRLGKLHIVHGHEYSFAISNPVNPARGLFLRGKSHALMSHMHQSSQHSEASLKGEVISTWSTGALCDLHPEYRPLNNWNLGYAYVETDKDGAFEVTNRRIVDGKAY